MAGQETYEQLIAEKVERALAPWRDLLPAEALEEMRAQLEDFIATQPAMERMLRQLLPPQVVASSGEVQRDDAPGDVAAKREPTGTGGRQ